MHGDQRADNHSAATAGHHNTDHTRRRSALGHDNHGDETGSRPDQVLYCAEEDYPHDGPLAPEPPHARCNPLVWPLVAVRDTFGRLTSVRTLELRWYGEHED